MNENNNESTKLMGDGFVREVKKKKKLFTTKQQLIRFSF